VGRWAGDGRPDKHDRQPFFLPVLFSSHEVSIASFKGQQKKRRFTTLLRIKHIRDLIPCHKEVTRELQEK
jgi:hypothetical protein